MNILHVMHNYYPSVGGPQYTMKHLSEKLAASYGDKVQVCTTNSLYAPESKLFKKINPSVELINDVEVNRLPFNRWHYPLINTSGKVAGKLLNKSLPYNLLKQRWGLDSPAMKKMMLTTSADVIMATTIVYNFADYPFWRQRTKNPKPFVLYGAIHLHADPPKDSPFIKRAKACDCYISNTHFESDKLVEFGVEKEKIITIGTGIAPDEFSVKQEAISNFKKQYQIEEQDIVIGFIGRLVKGKGVPVLIDAFRKLYAQNRNVKLLLAGGTTDYVPAIKKIILEEGIPIILIENFEESEKSLLYNVLDVFVLASQSESFGVVFLEAWACKKPVVATRMGAISSLLSEEHDSMLFEPNNSEELQSKLQLLISNSELRSKLGENGYEKMLTSYTWPVIVAKYRQAYEIGIENFNRTYNSTKSK